MLWNKTELKKGGRGEGYILIQREEQNPTGCSLIWWKGTSSQWRFQKQFLWSCQNHTAEPLQNGRQANRRRKKCLKKCDDRIPSIIRSDVAGCLSVIRCGKIWKLLETSGWAHGGDYKTLFLIQFSSCSCLRRDQCGTGIYTYSLSHTPQY